MINLESDDITDPIHDLSKSKSGMYCSTEYASLKHTKHMRIVGESIRQQCMNIREAELTEVVEKTDTHDLNTPIHIYEQDNQRKAKLGKLKVRNEMKEFHPPLDNDLNRLPNAQSRAILNESSRAEPFELSPPVCNEDRRASNTSILN